MEAQKEHVDVQLDRAAGMYLTFVLDQELYGLEILKVREIIGLMTVTAVPRTPDFFKGVINLRGNVIPVMDLRSKFGLPETETTEETCIIVVQVNEAQVGLIVDKVMEVADIAADDIDPPPALGETVESSFILGMGKTGEHVTILLDIFKVLQDTDLEKMQQEVQTQK